MATSLTAEQAEIEQMRVAVEDLILRAHKALESPDKKRLSLSITIDAGRLKAVQLSDIADFLVDAQAEKRINSSNS